LNQALPTGLAGRGPQILLGARVAAAAGGKAVRSVEVIDTSGRIRSLSCDLVAMSNGWNPAIHLATHLGGKPVWDEARAAFLPPANLPQGLTVAGAAAGDFDLVDTIRQGGAMGAAAASRCGFDARPLPKVSTDPEFSTASPIWNPPVVKGKAFVDFQNDVTASDVALAHREGFRSVEHLKRYTTLGMATDQGKTSNLAGHAMMASLRGESIAATGTTIFRPPYTPVAIGALAGHHRGRDFRPIRLTPSHEWAREQGAVFVEAGLWLRAQYFPQAGDRDWLDAAIREVDAVRNAVGVCDVSTLGKIDIQGADAAEFLERVYINGWKNLAVGKARYGLMLREDGFVMDDGTTSRLGETHFVMTTTTANAVRVMQHLEFCHQALWPHLDVRMVSVTEQWAQFSIAGPHSRDVLQRVVDPEHDISNEAFPYLTARAITVGGGVEARLFRISFSGELAYELAVPASYGDAAIRALMAAGAPYGIRPYGTEALGVMRIEKGHVAGNELNGQTTVRDLGLERMMSRKKDFIGRLMAERPALLDASRPRFVGFRPVDRAQRLRAGAHFVASGRAATAENDEGFMTSVAYSPTLKHWIGLGLLRRDVDPLRDTAFDVEVCAPAFVDPNEERLRV
jgi:sarcosine oxidase subunit alpha